MRQTSVFRLYHSSKELLFCVILLLFLFSSIPSTYASVSEVALQAQSPNGIKLNQGGSVSLSATWQGDTPPYSAKFSIGGKVIGSNSELQSTNSNLTIGAAAIGEVANSPFQVDVSDSSSSSSGTSPEAYTIDFTPPTLQASVLEGPNFPPSGTIRVQISSNEEINPPTVRCGQFTGAAEGNSGVGTSFIYSIAVTNLANGSHDIVIEATDTTKPDATANKGTITIAFQVGTGSTGGTNIDEGQSTKSPTNATTITIAGTAPQGCEQIAILNKGEQIIKQGGGQSWSVAIDEEKLRDGSHSLVAVSYDSLGIEISRSSAYPLVVDRVAPAQAAVSPEDLAKIPQNTNTSQISIPVTVDLGDEKTPPVSVEALVNGNVASIKVPVTQSGVPVGVSVNLADGVNAISFRTTDSAGNVTTSPVITTINKSSEATGYVTSVVVEGIGVPFTNSGDADNTNKMIGAGEHPIVVHFDNNVKNATPTIEIVTTGGTRIAATGQWQDPVRVFEGTFTIPTNGGATIDGSCHIVISNVKDIYDNTLNPYDQEAFSIDSTAPTSTIDSPQPIYVCASNSAAVTLKGTVKDNDGGSGIESLDLKLQDEKGQPIDNVNINIPLNTGTVSQWEKNDINLSELGEKQYKIFSIARDRAIRNANVENINAKTGATLIVDKTAPGVDRISLGNSGVPLLNEGETIPLIASDVNRIVVVATDSMSGIDFINTEIELTGPDGSVHGEKSNDGNNTIKFDFDSISTAGEYTITVTPVDKAGNAGEKETRKFKFNKNAPNDIEMDPPHGSIANKTNKNLAANQIKITLKSNDDAIIPSYEKSTVSVKYNGQEVGEKTLTDATSQTENPGETPGDNPGETSTETTAAMFAKLHGGELKADGSHDGTYYVTVIPQTEAGITGAAINKSFVYDNLPPVVVESNPSINIDNEVWFGLDTTELKVKLSDSPKDILENYSWQYPSTLTPQVPIDSTWYSGVGSGINQESNINWIIGTASATGYASGNMVSVRAPTVAEASGTTGGIASFVVTITSQDLANNGEEIPNQNIIAKTFKFDYKIPTITISTEKGKKYCKNLLKIEGKAEDSGEGAQVTKIQSSEDGSTWNDVTGVTGLPASIANFTFSIDISNKTDGNYTVKFRAVDRANNKSNEVEFTYIVDRTPPEPPELTIPLADYTVNKRNQGFRWSNVTDATAYVLQISDDSSFNNIVNTQTSNDYVGLKGAVCNTPEGSYSLPKDGTFYWRVGALEKCVDGFNISEFSETRKLIIDTVKPYIVSIAPTPSSSNIVSTGMVTFTIRFNEPIDSTIDFAATLTSAGGQVMKIEKVSSSGDTWTGTTVIPKNNSALYDGTAIITVEGAADIAGNLMAADSSHTIVVNTGPAFTTKLFSNPANEYEITIITKSSESLQAAPSVTVKQNAVKYPVTMNFLKDKFYSGSYIIDKENPGSAYINISGTDLYGMVGNSTVEFVIADVNASTRLSVSTPSGRASLKAAEGATYSRTAVYLISRDTLESPFTTSDSKDTTTASIRASAGIRASSTSKSNSELQGILGLDEVGPSNTKLKKCMLYTADINGEIIDTSKADKIHIYRQDSKGNWIFQGGELKDYKISAQITGLGRLALMADTTPPKANSMSPSNNAKLDTNYPEIKGQFADGGSGLVSSSFKLYIDGLQVKNVEMNKDGSFSYQLKQGLKEGKHEIKYEVSDKAGNSLVRAVTVNAPALLRVGEFSPYPNPARGNRINFAYNFGARPDQATLKIYDTSGHLVKKFGTEDFDRISGLIRWDLTNEKGKRIANGAYIYRLEISAGGQKVKKRGKFAVLR